jgi:hypothetical protein
MITHQHNRNLGPKFRLTALLFPMQVKVRRKASELWPFATRASIARFHSVGALAGEGRSSLPHDRKAIAPSPLAGEGEKKLTFEFE